MTMPMISMVRGWGRHMVLSSFLFFAAVETEQQQHATQ